MRETIFTTVMLVFFTYLLPAQNCVLQGYVFDKNTNNAMENVSVQISETNSNQPTITVTTNQNGIFLASIPARKTYNLQALKAQYNAQSTTVKTEERDKNKKVYTQIGMASKAATFTTKSAQLIPPAYDAAAASYGVKRNQYTSNTNPDGVAFSDVINPDDPYAEITNATRLVDENYQENAGREALKYERIPTAYEPNIRVKKAPIFTEKGRNEDLPTNYDTVTATKKITPPAPPQFGETIVATADQLVRTTSLPPNYSGYKVEFFTAFSELAGDHAIFRRHGNIILERLPNGMFSYLLGDFRNRETGEKFVTETMQNRYPNAQLIQYENGRRVTQKTPKKAFKNNTYSTTPPR